MRLDANRLRDEYQTRLQAGDTPTEAREWARDVAEGTVQYAGYCYAAAQRAFLRGYTPFASWTKSDPVSSTGSTGGARPGLRTANLPDGFSG